jgi:hypothetical protein
MSIRLSCECGKTLKVKDELEGKRIKCPNCQASLLVGDDSDSGVKKKKNGKAKAEAKGGGGKTIFVVLGLGVVLVGCCCFSGVGAGGGWYFLKGGVGSGQDAKIVGKWVADVEPPKKGVGKIDDIFKMAFGGHIEFKKDGTVIDNTPMTPITQGKWKTVASAGEVLTVELSQGPISKKLDIRLVSNDNIKITPADTKMELAFKRAQ